jgi:hypothetical protein
MKLSNGKNWVGRQDQVSAWWSRICIEATFGPLGFLRVAESWRGDDRASETKPASSSHVGTSNQNPTLGYLAGQQQECAHNATAAQEANRYA